MDCIYWANAHIPTIPTQLQKLDVSSVLFTLQYLSANGAIRRPCLPLLPGKIELLEVRGGRKSGSRISWNFQLWKRSGLPFTHCSMYSGMVTVGPKTLADEDVRGHIFDCDGTLLESMSLFFHSWKECCPRLHAYSMGGWNPFLE